jgi:hypothetical protein
MLDILHGLGHDEYPRRFGHFLPIINYFADIYIHIFLLVLYFDIGERGLELILEPSGYKPYFMTATVSGSVNNTANNMEIIQVRIIKKSSDCEPTPATSYTL